MCLTSAAESAPLPSVASRPGPARNAPGFPAVMPPFFDLLGLFIMRLAFALILKRLQVLCTETNCVFVCTQKRKGKAANRHETKRKEKMR